MKLWQKIILGMLFGFSLGVAQNYWERVSRVPVPAVPTNYIPGTTLV